MKNRNKKKTHFNNNNNNIFRKLNRKKINRHDIIPLFSPNILNTALKVFVFTLITIIIIHQIFSLARDWSKRIKWANIPQLKLGNIRGYSLVFKTDG